MCVLMMQIHILIFFLPFFKALFVPLMLQPVIFIEDKRLCLEELERISLLQEKMHKSS